MGSTLTAKGQVTIPKAVRDFLGLKPGSKVRFEMHYGGQVVLRPDYPAKRRRHLDRLRGIGVSSMTTDEIMASTRGPAWKSGE